MKKRLLPAAAAFAVMLAVLWQPAMSLPQHGDERMYVWKSAYYWPRLARLDFSPGTDALRDPGWDSWSFWAVEQPQGTNLIYALAMAVTGTPGPAKPFEYFKANGPEADIPPQTLPVVRLTGILCAALGMALIAWRLRWIGFLVAVGLLLMPFATNTLSRAWAEGPLLLGFGLVAASWGTRWLAAACGVAAAFKLTALGLWPFALIFGVPRRPFHQIAAFVTMPLVFSLLTPTTWLGGGLGPPVLINLILFRIATWQAQSATFGNVAGMYIDERYHWPFELALLVVLALLLPRLWRRLTPASRLATHVS